MLRHKQHYLILNLQICISEVNPHPAYLDPPGYQIFGIYFTPSTITPPSFVRQRRVVHDINAPGNECFKIAHIFDMQFVNLGIYAIFKQKFSNIRKLARFLKHNQRRYDHQLARQLHISDGIFGLYYHQNSVGWIPTTGLA